MFYKCKTVTNQDEMAHEKICVSKAHLDSDDRNYLIKRYYFLHKKLCADENSTFAIHKIKI